MSHKHAFRFELLSMFFVIALVVFGLVYVPKTDAAVSCTFTRDLELGMNGEDIRCLQKYLNSTSFTIANSGVGSPGNETSLFRDLTKEAVIRWQIANGVSPATGYFGKLSRAKYISLSSASVSTSVSSNTPNTGQVAGVSTANLTNLLSGSVAQIMEAYKLVKDTMNDLETAWDEVDEANDDNQDVGDAEDILEDAEDELLDAKNLFFEGYFDEVKHSVSQVHDLIRDALDEIDDSSRGLSLAEAIKFRNETVIKVEYNNRKYVIVTKKTSKNDIVEEILDEVDDDDLDDDDVEDELTIEERSRDSKASDKEFGADEDEAKDALDDAKDAINDAWEDVEDADDDGDDVDEAEDLLDEAEDLYDDAEDAFDDEDYDEVLDLTDEIQDLVDEALDSL